MKKILACTLALLLLLLTACGGQTQSTPQAAPAETEELDEIAHRLLADWYAYLVGCEHLYGDLEWALSYLEPFFEDHAWNSFQTAQATMSLAKRVAETLELPDAQMTFDDYDALVQSGADVGAVQTAVGTFPGRKDQVLLTYQTLRDYLYSPSGDIFQASTLEIFEEIARIDRQMNSIELQCLAVTTDYLLLTLDSQEEEARFLKAIAENCPRINACRKDAPQDEEGLYQRMNTLLDELETGMDGLAAVVNRAQVDFDRLAELDAGDYFEAMSAGAAELQGFPVALPYPDWWYGADNETVTYIWEREDGTLYHIMPGESFAVPPRDYIVMWADVSRQAYFDYLEAVEEYRMSAANTKEKDGAYSAYYIFPSASFILTWEDDTVRLYAMEGSVCLAPPWYVRFTGRAVS